MEGYLVVFCTVGSAKEGVKIARELVNTKLAACVNIIPKIRSIYRWKGKICDDPEILLVIKTRKRLFKKLKDQIIRLHSYEVAEVIAMPLVSGSEAYLKWLSEVTQA